MKRSNHMNAPHEINIEEDHQAITLTNGTERKHTDRKGNI